MHTYFQNFLQQKLLELPEHQKSAGGLLNNNLALQIKNATFAWEVHNIDFRRRGRPEGDSSNATKNQKKPGKVHVNDNYSDKKNKCIKVALP